MLVFWLQLACCLTGCIEWPRSTAFVLAAERKECGLCILVLIPVSFMAVESQPAIVPDLMDADSLLSWSKYVRRSVWSVDKLVCTYSVRLISLYYAMLVQSTDFSINIA